MERVKAIKPKFANRPPNIENLLVLKSKPFIDLKAKGNVKITKNSETKNAISNGEKAYETNFRKKSATPHNTADIKR